MQNAANKGSGGGGRVCVVGRLLRCCPGEDEIRIRIECRSRSTFFSTIHRIVHRVISKNLLGAIILYVVLKLSRTLARTPNRARLAFLTHFVTQYTRDGTRSESSHNRLLTSRPSNNDDGERLAQHHNKIGTMNESASLSRRPGALPSQSTLYPHLIQTDRSINIATLQQDVFSTAQATSNKR